MRIRQVAGLQVEKYAGIIDAGLHRDRADVVDIGHAVLRGRWVVDDDGQEPAVTVEGFPPGIPVPADDQ